MGDKSRSRRPQVRIFDSTEELSLNLADYITQLSESAVRERDAFSIAISGGNVPKLLSKLAGGPYLRTVDWSKWHVFWAEEKLVAKRHSDSNYRHAKQEFLSKVPVLPAHVYPVNTGSGTEATAKEYEFEIRQHVRNRTVGVSQWSDCPRFDLILLSMDNYGGVSSLVLDEPTDDQWVAPIAGNPYRVAFTLPVVNSAGNVAVVGPSTTLCGPSSASSAHHLISPVDGELVWFIDPIVNAALDD